MKQLSPHAPLPTPIKFFLSSLLLLGWIGMTTDIIAANKNEKLPMPDFTQGGKKDAFHDWNLGATGARGWIYGQKGTTADARQILVTVVKKDSPADGILAADDVIVGIGDKLFSGDARIHFANAVTEAEQDKNAGTLRLMRWRAGKTEQVQLKLAVMGTYSDTTPYDCPKSKKIFELGCQTIAKKGLGRVSIPNSLNALALLASGNKEYQSLLAEYAQAAAAFKADSFATWFYGYTNCFLAEYYMATGDKSVLEGLKRITMEAALGQSAVGTWGHKFARPDGNLNGYGAMNSPGLSLMVSMVLARHAGIKDSALDKAIAKSAGFLRWYVNKGAIPYGDHYPWPWHEDNGKCSNAAVLYDLLDDTEATSFYAKMSLAAYDERERGHTGNYFNMTWAMLGVARCGPVATGAYMKEQGWYYDLARDYTGSFGYQGSPAGEEEHGKYTKWDCSGAYLLGYALPLKSLYITGKRPSKFPALNSKEVDEVIAAGRHYKNDAAFDKRSSAELLTGLSSWSPSVRRRSAQALSRKDGDYVNELITLLASKNSYARYGACEALADLGPKADAAAPQLRALLNDADPWIQSLACVALLQMSDEVRKDCVTDFLLLTVKTNPDDPRGMVQRVAAEALFSGRGGGLLVQQLDGVDRQLLYPAVQSLLDNEDSRARGTLQRLYGKLNNRDIITLLPAIIAAVEQLAPSNEMFGDGIRLAGLDVVTRLHIHEGISLCLTVIDIDRWGMEKRLKKCLEYLSRYGVHAKDVIPQLKEMRAKQGENKDTIQLFDKYIADIESSKNSPTVYSVKEFIAKPLSELKKK